MNEQATLRFEFVSSGGGGGPGPAGLPAPSGSGSAPQPKQELPAASPAAGGGAASAKNPNRDLTMIDSIRAALGGLRPSGLAGQALDVAISNTAKIDRALSAIHGSSGAASVAKSAAPILPAASPSAAGAVSPAVPIAAASAISAGSAASAAIPIASAVIASAAFAGMVAKAANDIARANSTYSPDVAVAEALNEARTIRRQVELGKKFGADVAATTEAQSRTEDNIVRGFEREIANWNRLYRAGNEFAETASEINAKNRAAGRRSSLMRMIGKASPGLGALIEEMPTVAGWLESIDNWLRKTHDLQDRAARRAEEQSANLFSKVEHAPLPADLLWAEGRSDEPVTVKFNGPVMFNP